MTRGKSTVKCVRPMKDNFCESCVEEENTKRDLEEQLAKDKLSNKKLSTSSNKRKDATQVPNERDSKKPKSDTRPEFTCTTNTNDKKDEVINETTTQLIESNDIEPDFDALLDKDKLLSSPLFDLSQQSTSSLVSPDGKILSENYHNKLSSKYDVKELKRYVNRRTKNSSYVFTVPVTKVERIKKIIIQTLGINCDPKSEDFKTMDEAKEYFERTLLLFKKEQNFMGFKYPRSCSGYKTVRYMPNNDINLSFKDVKSVFDTAWLNDGLIGFVLECLNFYQYHTDGTSTAPNILFGTPLDYNNIMCNKDHLRQIHDHLNHDKSSSIPFDESEVNCSLMLKYWYCKETKHCTSKILDFFTANKNQIIKKYLNVIRIKESHWICIEAQLSDSTSNFIPKIYSIDPYGSDNATEVIVRRWYAKYFGLYYKEFKQGSLKDHDFNGRDLYYDKNFNNPTMGMDQKEFPSYLLHGSKDPTLLQMDNFNCGIHCIIECLAQLCGGHKYYQPYSKIGLVKQHKQLNHFRLCILTMVKKIYLELNEEYIYPIERHIHMKVGDVYRNTDVETFLTIHKLFDNGHFSLDMNKEDTQNGNANDVARFVDKKHIDEAWKILKVELDIQSQKPSNSNNLTETTNKKQASKSAKKFIIKLSTKKSQTIRGKQLRIEEDYDDEGNDDGNINLQKKKSKNKQRGERKAKASDFVVNDSDLSLERMWLNQLDQRSRHQTVYDVSDTILYLEEKQEANPIEVNPKGIVDRILNLYCKCYRPQELDRTKKKL